jgi:hypothetical protein
MGNVKPEFIIEALTLSRASLIDLSGSPTIIKEGMPLEIYISTPTFTASIPINEKLSNLKNIN